MLHTWSIIFTLTAVKELIQEHLTNKRPRSSIWQSKRLLIARLQVRFLSGSQLEPPDYVGRFLSKLQFDAREKVQELMDKLGN